MHTVLSQNVVEEWNLDHLSTEEQADFIERIGRLIYQAILVRSLDILSEIEQQEFDTLLDKDETTTEDVLKFLQRKIPNFPAVLKDEIDKLKADVIIKN